MEQPGPDGSGPALSGPAIPPPFAVRGSLRLRRGGFELDAAFEAPASGVTVLFGPSGSGKSTLLRCLAGLERPDSGRIEAAGEVWFDSAARLSRPPHRRAASLVFQEDALFPHLSVRENLLFGWRRTPPAERRIGPEDAVEWLGLGAWLDRRPAALSGGQRRRVAIARALLASPRLLLMDEPLTGLDAEAKAGILDRLEALRAGPAAVPMIYVTHALDEAARLSDWIWLIRHGRMEHSGPFLEAAARTDLPLARLEEAGAVIEARVEERDEAHGLIRAGFAGGSLWIPRLDVPAGRSVRIRIAARDVSLALDPPSRTSVLNVLPARVEEIVEEDAARAMVRAKAGATDLLARVTRRSAAQLGLAPGMEVWLQVKAAAILR